MIKDNLFGFGDSIIQFLTKKAYVCKSSTYAYKYELCAEFTIDNNLFLRLKKNSELSMIKNQIYFFMCTRLPKEILGDATIDFNERAKKGVKKIKVKHYFNDASYAYSLGYDLTEYSGHYEINLETISATWPSKYTFAEKEILKIKEFKMDINQKVKTLACGDKNRELEIWEQKFKPVWLKKLTDLTKNQLSLSAYN